MAAVLELANIPGAVGIMEAVIVVALLSACNTQIYGSSRFMQNLAVRGDAPASFARTDARGVPMRAVVVSVAFGFAAVALQYWNPPGLLAFLLNAVGGCLIVLWIVVALSFVRIHPTLVATGEITEVRGHCVINAAGVWTDEVQEMVGGRGALHVGDLLASP